MVDVVAWAASILLAAVFTASAAVKGTQSVERAVELGMTGVVDLPLPLMRLVAALEIVGVVGLFVPYLTGVLPLLTPLAALGLGAIMVPASVVHLRLREPATAAGNWVLLALCLVVAWARWPA